MLIRAAAGLGGAAALMAWAVRGRSSQVFGRSVWRGPTSRPIVALTFDDGPSESTPRLLEILDEFGARATFFQIGRNAELRTAASRAVAEAGHEIGNHGYSHKPFYLRKAEFIATEIEQAQRAISSAAGVTPRLFRAPFGCRWFGLDRALASFRLTSVMWTAIASDWRLGPHAVARRLLDAASNGAIFCLHDGRGLRSDPDIRPTLDALRYVLPELRARGYQFRTVSELLCLTT